MNNILPDVERVLAEQHLAYLKTLLHQYAIPVEIVRQLKDTHATVYGRQSGRSSNQEHFNLEVLITGDEFAPATSVLSGAFTEGFLYSDSPELLKNSDEVHIQGEDGKTRIFNIVSIESLGSTQEIFTRYRISAKGARVEEL